MIETVTALLLAHALADFLFQTDWINANKRHPGVMLLHAAIVLVTAQAAIGRIDAPELLALAAIHLVIDCLKTYGNFTSLTAFLADQAAHLATIAAVAAYAPGLWASGAWAAYPQALPFMALAAGLILALQAGQYAVGLMMKPHGTRVSSKGLRRGGQQIGLLERGLIFLFILTNHPIGVGFLVAAKSILRFGTATRDQRTAEYVIIGTLASFGWAIAVALATQSLLAALPALEIGAPRP